MTLLIKNVQLVDGVHDFPERADVFVADGKISAIGNFPVKQAAVVLDGQGAYLSPGFIDVDTTSDHYFTLFAYPGQADFLNQGVTTILGGFCGASLAPLLYGTLEGMDAWAGAAKMNVGWHTVAELLALVDKRPLGVNFGTFAGHATIRRAIAGDEPRELTRNEKPIFERTVREALAQGAFGVSTGLGHAYGRKVSSGELGWIVGILKDAGGIHAAHLRDPEDGVEESVAELARLAKSSGVRTLVSHFVPFAGSTESYARALAFIGAMPPQVPFRFDIYPFDQTLLPLSAFLPVWAQGAIGTMAKNIKDEWLVRRIVKEMAPLALDRGVIVQAPGHEFLVGKTLADVADMYEVREPREAFLRLCAATDMRGVVLYRNLDEGLVRRALSNPRAFIASHAPGFGGGQPGNMFRSERTTGTFTKFLSWVQDENLMPLKDAIRKISYEPARFFGLAGRGELREGAVADLTCFRGGEVKFTVVGGRVATKDGEFKEVYAGKALRRK